ncbi:DUF2325 domain-containing protein [Vallitalea guaymasensis]|uniref:DUF2325 domain-containing protein n=1 Tax=Vallitalea guaymasensis TaxID=1185412 RepID=UPI000DE45449|nr:DUF2325 domain-containing protein [Vallitalea guaymasensis]
MSNKKNIQEFNLTLFLTEAIASNKKVFSTIDKLYEQNSYRAYKLARESEYYDHPIFCSGSILRNIMCKRILGLILLDMENEKDAIKNIIQKGWNNLYNYMKNYNKDVKLEKVVFKFANIDMTDDEVNAVTTIIIVLTNIFNNNLVQDEVFNKYITMQIDRLNFYNNNSQKFSQFCYNNLTKDEIKRSESIYDRICNTYHPIKNINDINNFRRYEEISKYLDAVLMITNTENLEFNDEMILYDERDIIEILALYWMVNKNQNAVEATKYLIQGIIFKYFLKDYNNIKNYYFKNNKETMFYKIEDKDQEINSLRNDKIKNNNVINQQSSEIELLKKRINSLEKDLLRDFSKEKKELNNKIKQLKKQNKKLQFADQELEKLKDLLFVTSEEVIYKEKDIDISKYDIILVGGHESLQKQLRVLYTNIRCYDGFNPKISISKAPDLILFFWQYMNHATYDVVINYCRKNNIKFNYVTASNIELLCKQIQDIMAKKLF